MGRVLWSGWPGVCSPRGRESLIGGRLDFRRKLFYGCSSLREKVMALFTATSEIYISDLHKLRPGGC